MKKKILFCAMAFLIISISYAARFERQIVPAADFGEQVEISFTINPEGAQSFEFTDAVPSEWEFISWTVQGISQESVTFTQNTPGLFGSETVYRWAFENVQNPITLSYSAIVKSVGEVSLSSMLVHGEEISTENYEIFVRAVGVVCGDGICQSAYGENVFNCPEDCPFKSTPYFWISLLLLATIIVISGIIHREYKKTRGRAGRTKQTFQPVIQKPPKLVKKPEKVIHFRIKEKPVKAPAFPKLPVFKEKEPVVKKIKTKPRSLARKTKKPAKRKTAKKIKKISRKVTPKKRRTIKKTAKKPARRAKKTPKSKKSDKFYKDTLSRLEKIKKELK